jgi:DNA-binding transcriptional LysR family regulator
MFDDIITFRAIVQHKNLTKAGKELGLSTSIVTRRLVRLEKSLNTRLIQRTTRQLHLTEAGELFLAETNNIMQALEVSKDVVKNLNKEVTGMLKVGLPPNLSYLYVSKMLHKFIAQYPNINIQIATGNHLLGLLANGFDLIIHAGVLPDSDFYFKKIGSWKKIFFASPDYLNKNGIPTSPAELKLHNCIDHADNYERAWEYSENNIIKKVIINSKVRVDNNFDIRQLALNGIGIAHLSKCAVYDDLKQGRLISILEDFQTPEFETFAVYPSKKFINKKTQVFLEFVDDLLKSISCEMKN